MDQPAIFYPAFAYLGHVVWRNGTSYANDAYTRAFCEAGVGFLLYKLWGTGISVVSISGAIHTSRAEPRNHLHLELWGHDGLQATVHLVHEVYADNHRLYRTFNYNATTIVVQRGPAEGMIFSVDGYANAFRVQDRSFLDVFPPFIYIAQN